MYLGNVAENVDACFAVGSLACLAALAAYGADFDQVDLKNKLEGNNGGNTPLHYAALGHGMCCRFLTQRGECPGPVLVMYTNNAVSFNHV